MVAITTADSPKIVLAQSGKRPRLPEDWIIPIPRATEIPTTEVFLAVSFSFVMSRIPVMEIMEKTEIVAPPRTQEGMVDRKLLLIYVICNTQISFGGKLFFINTQKHTFFDYYVAIYNRIIHRAFQTGGAQQGFRIKLCAYQL